MTVEDKSQQPATDTKDTAATTTDTPSQVTDNNPTLQDLQKQFEQIKADFQKKEENLKKEISGLNRKNSEYETALKQKELEKLDEKERLIAEKKMLEEEREKEVQALKQTQRLRNIDKALFDSGLPDIFTDRIKGDTPEEIKEDVNGIKAFIDAEVNKRVEAEINKRLAGKAPEAGKVPAGKVITLAEFNAYPPKVRAEFMAGGGQIKD